MFLNQIHKLERKNGIWEKAFVNKNKIELTDLTGRTKSLTNLSSLNSTEYALVSYPLTFALISILVGRVSAGISNNLIHCECIDETDDSIKFVLNYHPDDHFAEMFAARGLNKVEFDISHQKETPWALFVPRIIELLQDPLNEVSKAFSILKSEYENHGTLSSNKEIIIFNDYIYQSRDDYLNSMSAIKFVSPYIVNVDKVLSVICKNQTLDFAQVNVKKSNISYMKPSYKTETASKITDDFSLGWDSPLDPEDEIDIPDLDLRYIKVTSQVKRLALMVKAEHDSINPVRNIILYGEAGSGKSTAVKYLAKAWNLPYRFINLSLNSDESELIGTFRPKTDGTFEFYEPSFARTYRKGGVVEIMEINYGKPGVLGIINSALDDTSKLILGNGEIVNRHKNCIIIATTNVNYIGCQKMNEALKDRFQEICAVNKLSKDDLIDIAIHESGNNDRTVVAKMADAVEKISIKITEEQITGGVCSTRQLCNWARDYKYTKNVIESAKTTILPGVSLDLSIQQEILDCILNPMF